MDRYLKAVLQSSQDASWYWLEIKLTSRRKRIRLHRAFGGDNDGVPRLRMMGWYLTTGRDIIYCYRLTVKVYEDWGRNPKAPEGINDALGEQE